MNHDRRSGRTARDRRTDEDAGSTDVTRRRYLRLVGGAAVGAAAGCSSPPSPTPSPSPSTSSPTTSAPSTSPSSASGARTNVVDEGADDTGESAVNSVVNQAHGDDVELYFPPGRYRLDPLSLSGSGWSLVGDDATLVVPASVDRDYLYLEGSDWTVDGFTIDLRADGAAPVNYLLGRDWEFKNVRFVGQMDDPEFRGDSNLLYPAVQAEGATGLVENVSAMDGSADPGESSNRGLTWFGPNNVGKLIWRGCQFSKWANNTLYAAESVGPVLIENCLFENTNVGVRVGGQTTVRNCLWLQDGRVPAQRWTGDSNGRGLWLNSNGHVRGPIRILNCDFVMTGSDAVTAIYASHKADEVEIRDTRIRQDVSNSAIKLPGDGPTTIRGVDVTGQVREAAITLTGRDGSVVADTCIDTSGDGIRISDAANCRVENVTVNVEGEPLVFGDSDVATENVSRTGSCSAPDRTNPATDG